MKPHEAGSRSGSDTAPGGPGAKQGGAGQVPSLGRFQQYRILAALTATMFIVYTSISMLAPLLVDLAVEFDTSVGAVGQLAAVTALPWAIMAPFMGVLSDRYGRRPVLAAGTALLGVATVLSAFSWSYGSLMVIRIIGGIGGATSGPNLFSAAADYFPAHRRGMALGTVISGLSLASVAGVPLVAVAAAYAGWRFAFGMVGAALLGIAAIVWITLPRGAVSPGKKAGVVSGLTSALSNRFVAMLLLSNVLERGSFTAVTTYLAAYLMQSYGLALDEVAPVLSVIAIGTLAGSLAGGRLADRGRQVAVYTTLQLLAAALVLPVFIASPGVAASAALAAAFGVVNSLARPAWLWMITTVPESVRGATTGFMATSNQLGLMVGASIGGIMVAFGGYQGVGMLASGAALTAAILCYLAAARRQAANE